MLCLFVVSASAILNAQTQRNSAQAFQSFIDGYGRLVQNSSVHAGVQTQSATIESTIIYSQQILINEVEYETKDGGVIQEEIVAGVIQEELNAGKKVNNTKNFFQLINGFAWKLSRLPFSLNNNRNL